MFQILVFKVLEQYRSVFDGFIGFCERDFGVNILLIHLLAIVISHYRFDLAL
jgi:hypothetical protein